jgi:pSer/pThr/pTyr-binding forkhead associated (FHA) protein
VLHDLGSSNGTYINDVRLTPGSVNPLKQDDLIRFGNVVKFTFQLRAAEGQKRQPSLAGISRSGITGIYGADEQQIAVPLGQPVLNDDGSLLLPGASRPVPAAVVSTFRAAPALVVLAARASGVGGGVPEIFMLEQGKRLVIGREKGNEIALADVVLSRRHAEIFPGPDGFYIRDLESSNGVRVNQTRIGNPYLLAHGDRIEIGSSIIYFIDLRSRLRETESVPVPSRGLLRTKQAVGVGVAAARPEDSAYAPTVRVGGLLSGKRRAVADPRVVICRTCGVANTPVARFCAGCSAPLGSQPLQD